MKTNSRNTGFTDFFTDAKSAESVRRQFIEAPLEAARQSMFGPAFELAQLLRVLPDAFAASQQRELKRVKASAEENDPRVAYLEASIEQADTLRTMARRGEVRAQRSLIAYATRNEVFHGFVSDSEMNPLRGLTVQIVSGKVRGAKELKSNTDDEGYFSISIGKKSASQWGSEKEGDKISPEKLADLLANREKEKEIYEQQNDERKGVRVAILKKGKLIHEDPVPMGLGEGSVYREYVISDKEYSSPSDFQDFMYQRGDKPTSPSEDAKKRTANTSRTGADVPGPSASAAAARPGAKKRTSQGKKSTKSIRKK